MNSSFLSHPALLWGFGIVILAMLLLDLGVFNKKSHTVGNREALVWSVVWIGLAMCFSLVIYFVFRLDGPSIGLEKFAQFQSAYWIEKALSVDNLFVFILVFKFFKVPTHLHHTVLFWGIIGALVFRAIFIFSGVGLIKITYLPEMEILGKSVQINIVLTLFGIFLIYAGIKSWFGHNKEDEEKEDLGQSAGVRFIKFLFAGRVTDKFHDKKFTILQNGKRYATPLLMATVVVEFSDLLFAVDSIPAIFAIAPDDPFILYTSNIFAILGLRSLYFLLANFIDKFHMLSYGLAVILFFIGVKMLVEPFFHISSMHSLIVVATVLIISVIVSVRSKPKQSDFL